MTSEAVEFAIDLAKNPINWVLAAASLYLLYTIVAPSEPRKPPVVYKPRVVEPRNYTPSELRQYDGRDGKDIYMAVNGLVYDVSAGRSFYGPGSMYGNFAGRDASRGLAKDSFDAEMITPEGQPIDKLEDLTSEEREGLKGWAEFFHGKYIHIGYLVEEGTDSAPTSSSSTS